MSHRSAALLHGLPLLKPPSRPDLTVVPSGTGDVAAALLHRASLDAGDVRATGGVAVTSIARTLVDIGRATAITEAVVTMDAALHRGVVFIEEIEAVLGSCWNWPKIRRAMRAVSAIDARSESPLESVSRLVMTWLKVAAPQLQTALLDEFGIVVGRADFYWPEFGVVGEADGRMKYDSRDVLMQEKQRQERLEQLGLIVVRWTWTDVSRYPHLLRQRLDTAFERGRLRDRSGFPRKWSV